MTRKKIGVLTGTNTAAAAMDTTGPAPVWFSVGLPGMDAVAAKRWWMGTAGEKAFERMVAQQLPPNFPEKHVTRYISPREELENALLPLMAEDQVFGAVKRQSLDAARRVVLSQERETAAVREKGEWLQAVVRDTRATRGGGNTVVPLADRLPLREAELRQVQISRFAGDAI